MRTKKEIAIVMKGDGEMGAAMAVRVEATGKQ
jgi:hypothetical protein